jgi:hypothetical protein
VSIAVDMALLRALESMSIFWPWAVAEGAYADKREVEEEMRDAGEEVKYVVDQCVGDFNLECLIRC